MLRLAANCVCMYLCVFVCCMHTYVSHLHYDITSVSAFREFDADPNALVAVLWGYTAYLITLYKLLLHFYYYYY